ncbi:MULTISPECIES: hypothetical protein [unclassified Pedobacter]|uniref:hypothetical protein n=1 Tax=unclassified Pedobacter TaxID=2628915 RepID=UPI001E41802F|nr:MULTISPECIES: hypothetical protein [unclassified Pedobacter]
MENQLTNNANALRLFFTDDVFLVEDNSVKISAEASDNTVLNDLPTTVTELKSVPTEGKETTSISNIQSTSIPVYQENSVKTVILEEPLTQPKPFKFLGGNKKSVLILVNDNVNDVSTEQGRDLLRKIVKAIDLVTADFALLNYAAYHNTDFSELQQFFNPQLMLSFGVDIHQLKLNLAWKNEIILYQNTRMIFAPNLHDLDADLPAKKMLWANLQLIK